jgi:hypothetical protein
VPFSCWRWSDHSLDQARSAAREVAARIRDRITRGEALPVRYAYGTRPLREERLSELEGSGGAPSAILTRNSYGSVILNTAGAMFVDSDTAPGLLSSLRRLFGGRGREPSAALESAEAAVAEHPGLGLRVYQTRNGARYLVTSRPYAPQAEETAALMRALRVDPAYLHLCKVQGSFRARLTPKYWRVGLDGPPTRFPYESPEQEFRVREWTRIYDVACAGHATCRFLGQCGEQRVDPALQPVVELHDRETRSDSGLPLA